MIENNKNKTYKDLEVIYEDNHIIIVNKFANIPSQADKTQDADMLTLVKEYIKHKYDKKGEVYLGLVHRLDRPVAGLMVFARTSKAASRLSESIREKEFKKSYLAIVNGKLKEKTGTFEDYLVKDERNNISKVVKNGDIKNSKKAILGYELLESKVINKKEYSLVKIDLKTGRHHQIRVQFSNAGYPLYGDQKYGRDVNKVGEQLALFAYSLQFKHPVRDEIMDFNILPKLGIWKEFNINDNIR